ncbi:MAG: amino acid-binding protein [Armatimonadetes bacterium]|nr:amino acid-binding protein [Candidatus Hippobium faecium]
MDDSHFTVTQLTVFIENKPGRSAHIATLLAEGGINLTSFNIADTSEYGLLRFIADDPVKAKEILKEHNISARSTEIIVAALPDKVGGLAHVLNVIKENNVNIGYLYAFVSRQPGEVVIGMKVDNVEESVKKLREAGMKLLCLKDLL